MPAERDAAALPDRARPSLARRPRGDLVASGAELVALSERFYGGAFVGAIGFVGLAALTALVLLPAREFAPGTPVAGAFAATGLVAVAAVPAAWRAREVYCALRRRPQLQLALVVVAAALIAYPTMSSGLWWPSCAILMALALVASLRRALAYCLLVLAANLAGHLAAGDLGDTHAVDIIGLWIGYPLWIVAVATVADRLVAQVLRLNAPPPPDAAREQPRRVPAWSPGPPGAPAAPAADVAVTTAAGAGPPPAAEDERRDVTTRRLTARQLQVVALLADGLRQREVASCLSISERQVQRHIADSVSRLGLRNAYELAAVAVSEGIVPDAAAQAARG
jgi:DNA-binding CsgD family transcriptional regulator